MADSFTVDSLAYTGMAGTLRTGAIPPARGFQVPRITLAQSQRLGARQFGFGSVPPTLLNSSALISALGVPAADGKGWMGLGSMGNDIWGDCVSAEEGHHKQIITSSTGATLLNLPSGTYFDKGTYPDWKERAGAAPGVIPWAEYYGFEHGANLSAVLDAMCTVNPRGWVGMLDDNALRHRDGVPPYRHYYYYAAIDLSNPIEVQLALQHFKTIKIGFASACLQSWNYVTGDRRSLYFAHDVWNHGSYLPTDGEDHCACVCDCGTASAMAAYYNTQVPDGIDPNAFTLGLISWGFVFAITLDWLVSNTAESYVRITDPDRGDAATFNPIAEAELGVLLTNPQRARHNYAENTLCN